MGITEKFHRINKLKEKADHLAPNKDWDLAFLDKVKVEFTYSSNKIEGNTITHGQTIKLLKELVTPKHATTGEVQDLINHHQVLDIVFKNFRSEAISVENIQELHKALMKNIEQWADDGLYSPGVYKVFDNMTVRSSGKIHTYLGPREVPGAMNELIVETNNRLGNTDVTDPNEHPLSIATFFHQKFLNEIHPFADGNGRIGRIFTNLILLKKGFPPIFIANVDRIDYLQRFELGEEKPDAMLDFMADRLIESLEMKIIFGRDQP
jgi:Fic family protein